MQNLPKLYILAVIVIAFIAGYSIVSFILRFFKKTSTKEGTDAKQTYRDNGSPLSLSGEKDERYYARTFGFQGPVTVDDVKRRYRELMSQYHPDKVDRLGSELKEVAAQKTREINEAYEYFKKKYRIS